LVAGTYRARQGLTGDQALVHLAAAIANASISGKALSRARQQMHAGFEPLRRQAARGAVARDHRRGASAQVQKIGGGAQRTCAHAKVEIAADEQEKQQGNGSIEIDLVAAVQRLQEAHAGRERDPERNRHVHVEPARCERTYGRGKEWPTGIGYRR